MGSYSLLVKKSAEKELRALPRPDLERVVRRIKALAGDPRPRDCRKLSGEERYRIRQGDWRVVYAVDEERRVVEIVKIGHRKDVYR
jgi:mRNA interferase RelE/StbE